MKSIGGTSKYIAFLDECGDHSLDKIDNDFPVFLLAVIVVERKDYADIIIPEISKFKLKNWNHEGVNLHSRDIRKAKGPFSFLQIKDKRDLFLSEMSNLMNQLPYTLFISAINKLEHKKKYGASAQNPYHFALELNMERIMHFLKSKGEQELPIIAEARGRKEDNELEIEFLRIMTKGTFFMSAYQFKQLECPLVLKDKFANIAGIQLADLCAHPCARHILRPEQKNQAFDIVKGHLYKNGIEGWKVFP